MKSHFFSLTSLPCFNTNKFEIKGLKYSWKVLLVSVILFESILFAQIPRTISYQGILTDNSGNPKPDGDYSITFSFYVTKTGGDPIWTESKNLNISKGLFFTLLGDQTPFGSNVKFDKQYFLGIKIGDEAELTPRITLTSAGYSFSSINSDTAKNVADRKVVKSLNGLKDNVKIMGEGGTTVSTVGDTITISSSSGSGSGIQGIENSDGTIEVTNPSGPTTTLNLKVPLFLNGSVGAGNSVFSSTDSSGGDGVTGKSSLGGNGVQGLSTSGVGVWGESDSYIGVYARSHAPSAGYGIFGIGGKYGVYGTGNEFGVYGYSQDGDGVYGRSNSKFGKGVFGYSNINDPASDAVYGHSVTGIGVHGYSAHSGDGVYGKSESGIGVHGETTTYYGVYGHSPNWYGVGGESNGYGIIGRGTGSSGVGVYGTSSNSYAAIFQGDVKIIGTLIKSAGSFKIDHPLDPANKYLSHSFVESPDMMNIYNGNVITDMNGSATIALPDWFEALNKDFRYQLTVIGQFSQAIVNSKIRDNQFSIKTDKPNVEVSWQVTGIRKDAYAEQHRIKVEEYKNEKERGKYLHPELYGQSKEIGIKYVPEVDVNKTLPSEQINSPGIPDEMKNDARR